MTIGYKTQFAETKTDRWRTIELDTRTVEVLREHAKRQAVEIEAAGDTYGDAEHPRLVFCTQDGGPLHPDRVSKLFAAHVKAPALPRIRLHDLRHTHATLALSAGMHPKVVQERLGHASITITLDTYTPRQPGDRRRHRRADRRADRMSRDARRPSLCAARLQNVRRRVALARPAAARNAVVCGCFADGPWRNRTSNLGIKSPLLCQLS